jgi:hypothetical protein
MEGSAARCAATGVVFAVAVQHCLSIASLELLLQLQVPVTHGKYFMNAVPLFLLTILIYVS